MQLLGEAGVADMQERPVPVVIVMVAELLVACLDLLPDAVVEGKPHVVFGRHPLSHLNLGVRTEGVDVCVV